MPYDDLTGLFCCSWDVEYYYGPKNLLIPPNTRKIVVSLYRFSDMFSVDEDCFERLQNAFEEWHVKL